MLYLITTSLIEFIPGTELSGQLDHWLNQAELTYGPARAIIAPHAGYSYCGACGAFAYRQVSPAVVYVNPSYHQ